MSGSTHFDRVIRALTDRSPFSWRPKRSFRFAHSAVMSLLLFLIAFLLMGVPVFASSGGPPVAKHVAIAYRAPSGGSGINPVKHTGYTPNGGSGITPVK